MTKLMISFLFAFAFSANALPLPSPERIQNMQLTDTFSPNYNFEGIVALSNCSGSLIRLENSQDGDLAMVLTNGHCLEGGMPRPNQFIHNKSSNRSFTVLDPNAKSLGSVRASKIMYATMTGTDMAVYKLTETYAQIQSKYNVRALTLSSQQAKSGIGINVVSGYWKRGYTCAIDGFVDKLLEAGWEMIGSIRYSRPGCEVIGGTSGSPVIEAGTRIVVGVNNTINESGQMCSMNNPCEVDKSGNKSAQEGVGYAQQTYWLYSCLSVDNEVDLSRPGCMLFH